MTVITGINPSLLTPQTFHVITYLLGSRALVPLPQRGVLIGVQSATATALPDVVVPVNDPNSVNAMFGQGSILALMAIKALNTMAQIGEGPALFACPIAEGATAKQVETFTQTGTATADGNLIFKIAGRLYNVGVSSGMTAAQVGPLVQFAIAQTLANIPYTVGTVGGVTTLTGTVKGPLTNDTVFEVIQMVPGLVSTFAQTTAGSGVSDMQPALDAIAGQQFDGIACCNHTSADVTEVQAHINVTWAAAEKKPRWFFFGEPGSIGTATALGANHEGIVVLSWEQSRSLPCEIASAGMCLALSKSQPNANYDGAQVPLYPPPIAYNYTTAEKETALGAGLTPLQAVVDPNTGKQTDGVGSIVRLITSRTTDASGNPYTLTKDFGISRTAWYMAKQYDIAYAQKFGAAAALPEGALLDDDTIAKIRDMVINLNYAAQTLSILKNVDTDKTTLVVEEDSVTVGRVNVDVAYTIVVGLHQVAFVHRAQVG